MISVGTVLACFSFNLYGQYVSNQPIKNKSPFFFEASYIGDFASNLRGGIKQGSTYLGLANLKIGFNTDEAGWWKGGTFFVNGGNTHGGRPSEYLIGDFQGVSNIEAGNLTFLYELWYKQMLKRVTVTTGLQDLNANFAVCTSGALFLNSSFGIMPSISGNIPAPIFPLTALGISVQWNVNNTMSWQSALYDGTPDDFQSNPYNTKWCLGKNNGILSVTEVDFAHSLIKELQGSYKAGFYFRHCNDSVPCEQTKLGFYFIGEQEIWKTKTRRMVLFSQLGINPTPHRIDKGYISIGLNYNGLLSARKEDQAGVAIAYLDLKNGAVANETTVEMTYQWNVNPNVYLKPDVQYVFNPARTGVRYKNAVVSILRFGIHF